ncbi:tRNA cytosine(34) acetyltransferase TmcA [Halorubrum persicum]|uniref:tRNA(Met) cytidine acetyltransferase TmcA n=1 Tax=Halorubrum persicum TaxID=1383844 RepID=A0A2G1WLM9_9EURY|nr:tRNA(Met) cytidine acetyltransferase TmcA [Halorubrum persicum]PHQ39749.1 tRNA cytosine(34) acetyltransferase TmcA [Halorubrum persicum]
MIAGLARGAKREAEATNERRVLVLAGDRDRGFDAAYDAIEAVVSDESDDVEGRRERASVSIVSTREGFRFEEHRPRGADELLGRTREVVVLDCHEQFVPNAVGRCVGAVDGGGLLVLLTPGLDAWPAIRDRFDDSLAVPPYEIDDVTGRFRDRFVDTLRSHPGIAIASLGADGPGGDAIERDGRTGPRNDAIGASSQRAPAERPAAPPNAAFPTAAYEACLTGDQVRAVRAFESLATPGNAVVAEADRGRGKSSAAGIAAGALALAGADVLVTAPAFRNAAEVFERAEELFERCERDENEPAPGGDAHRLDATGGGRVRYRTPAEAADLPDDPDAVIVDEAAALPVRLLERFLDAPAVAFCTTVHGYEGAGRGFSIRFRERLRESRFAVRDVRLDEPIRYARSDPVEAWASRALLLDARPAVDEAVAGAALDGATYRTLAPDDLLADEALLREAFGLLVAAHYRTEPNDLARLLDAPNLAARALVADGRVVAVALLAREGGLDAETRRRMYEGERVRGNMVPDVLTSQLRDEAAAEPRGLRTLRIATHHALRGEGFGARLLDEVHGEFGTDGSESDGVDYFSVGYGATPRLLRFWRRAGYRTVHLSTSRNDASGEHSAIMVRPVTAPGEDGPGSDLLDRHAVTFRDRERDGLSDAHRDVEPDVVVGALRACSAPAPTDLTEAEWRSVVGASFGPGMYDSAPGAFRDLALAALIEGDAGSNERLDDREERLLVEKVLQGRPSESVADDLGYVSTGACMRALGDAYKPLVERYGTDFALEERERFTSD